MPGYELIGKEELEQLTKLIENNHFLMRHAGPPDKFSPCKKVENYFSNFVHFCPKPLKCFWITNEYLISVF